MNPFKKGDKVVCISYESSIYNDSKKYLNNVGIKIGDVVIIEQVTCNGDDDGNYLSFVNKSYVHPYDCFKLDDGKINYEIY